MFTQDQYRAFADTLKDLSAEDASKVVQQELNSLNAQGRIGEVDIGMLQEYVNPVIQNASNNTLTAQGQINSATPATPAAPISSVTQENPAGVVLTPEQNFMQGLMRPRLQDLNRQIYEAQTGGKGSGQLIKELRTDGYTAEEIAQATGATGDAANQIFSTYNVLDSLFDRGNNPLAPPPTKGEQFLTDLPSDRLRYINNKITTDAESGISRGNIIAELRMQGVTEDEIAQATGATGADAQNLSATFNVLDSIRNPDNSIRLDKTIANHSTFVNTPRGIEQVLAGGTIPDGKILYEDIFDTGTTLEQIKELQASQEKPTTGIPADSPTLAGYTPGSTIDNYSSIASVAQGNPAGVVQSPLQVPRSPTGPPVLEGNVQNTTLQPSPVLGGPLQKPLTVSPVLEGNVQNVTLDKSGGSIVGLNELPAGQTLTVGNPAAPAPAAPAPAAAPAAAAPASGTSGLTGTTASGIAQQFLAGGAAPQNITYGASLTPADARQLVDVASGKLAGDGITPATSQAALSNATGVSTPPAISQVTTQTAAAKANLLADATKATVGADPRTMQAATTVPTSTEVSNQQAAQLAQPTTVAAPQNLQITPEQLVSAPADAAVASTFAEQIQAAQGGASELATVQGQLASLMADFENGATPTWAAGAMRNATAVMAQRGLGASSMAGQAIVQAAMEAALPIAAADAQVIAQFDLQNLSNKQQRAMLSAQQRAAFMSQEFDQDFQARVQNAARVADIANINFSADQQIALENAKMAQTVDLNNLANKQALVLAEVAQIAGLETANLNNRQQAAVQNAQAFLQVDLTNTTNKQQVELFKSQSKIQALLTDTAAENAAKQFNASSENQVNQFFSNLNTQVSQFNATQANAISQFNSDQSNVITRFTEEINNQRELFNAQNRLIIDQANAQWFRATATADTAAVNFANQQSVQNLYGFTNSAFNNMYQLERDMIEQAFTAGEGDLDRATELVNTKMTVDAQLAVAEKEESAASSAIVGGWVGTIIDNIYP